MKLLFLLLLCVLILARSVHSPSFDVRLKGGDYFCFDNIIVKIKELPNPEREMIKEVITLCKLILVNPATSAADERSFSTARRLKSWLRSRMNQERFSNLTVLKIHKERTDRLSTIDIANEFTTATQTESVILALLE